MSTPPASHRSESVLLRTARAGDDADLARLAALDSARPLSGPAVVAEENGVVVAALCLSTGRAVADPFVPTLHLVELLFRHAARREVRGRRAHGAAIAQNAVRAYAPE